MTDVRYHFDLLLPGFPGRSLRNGALGWCNVALLRGGGETLVVDTGSDLSREELRRVLGTHGVRPSDVTGVLLTHCHADHICNFPLFDQATVYVSGQDLHWAVHDSPGEYFVPEFHVRELAQWPMLRLIDGFETLLPGITSLPTPGHTPGHTSFLVEGEEGMTVFAGDAVKSLGELTRGRAAASLDPVLSTRSIEDVRQVAADHRRALVVPGHDRVLRFLDGRLQPTEPADSGIVVVDDAGQDVTVQLRGGS